ncbi:MAG: methyltransferase domain-containing protein [Chloroflexi bacterium]|nr:MAG: methyltransferase domain-containing protein [Chloroflexota bacterium]
MPACLIPVSSLLLARPVRLTEFKSSPAISCTSHWLTGSRPDIIAGMDGAVRYHHAQIDLTQDTSHAQLLLLTGENKKVLEVGPATGYLTELLKGRGCRVAGLEIDPAAAEIARQFCERMIVGDIEALDLVATFGEDKFDVVMFGDVLEHLIDPKTVLMKMRGLLAPGGRIVASVPNVAHGSVRLALLRGDFHYTELGLLDRTHLRFFNREGVAALFEEAGYVVRDWHPVANDLFSTELELREEDYPPYLVESIRSDPDAATYQFVVSATPATPLSNGNLLASSDSAFSHSDVVKDLWKIDDNLREARAGLAEKEAQIIRVEAAAESARRRAARSERERAAAERELAGAIGIIQAMQNSIGWRLLNKLRPVARKLAPRDSLRFRIARRGARTAFSIGTLRPLRRAIRRGAASAPLSRLGATESLPAPVVSRLRVGCYGEHTWSVGGGAVHTIQLLQPLTRYFDVDLLLPPGSPLRDAAWYKESMLIDLAGINVRHYAEGAENEYDVWLSVWNERIWPAATRKRFNMVFFPFVSLDGAGVTHITNSKYSAGHLKQRYGAEDVYVIPPCVDANEFATGPKEPIILHVSRFALPSAYADKAHVMMIQAFKQLCERGLSGWKLILAGATVDEGESVYAAHLAKHAHGYPVEFALNLPADELRRLFARASVYWHATGFSVNEPAAQEHFGITIVEGMASGAVPIAYNSGGPREIITSGENGYLFDTLEQLVEDTWEVATKPAIWKKVSKAARQRAGYFSPQLVEKLMLSAVCKTEKVSIIMGTHNNLPVLKRCLESVFRHTPPGFELIVVDNNSSDGSGVYLASLDYPGLQVLRNRNNPSYPVFNNQGLELATRPYILYMNDDMEAFPGWLEPLIDVLDANPRVGGAGSRLLYPDGRVQHDGKMFSKADLTPYHINMGGRPVRDEPPIEVDTLTAACLLVRRELAGFSTDYKRGYYEDTDLCLRIKERGYALVLHRGSVLIHYHGQTMGRDQAATERAQERNREVFLRRWGAKIPGMVYLADEREMAGTELRCRPLLGADDLMQDWPVTRRLLR